MKFRCASCKKIMNAPLKRRILQCDRCGTHVLVNTQRPFSNIVFLFFIAMPFVAGYSTLSGGSWHITDLAASAALFIIPAGIYFIIMFFSGTKVVDPAQFPRELVYERNPSDAHPAPGPSDPQPARGSMKVFTALFLLGFLAWTYVYLFKLRPIMNAWLAQYISEYPAMLHLIPIIGLPVLVWIALLKLFGNDKHARQQSNPAQQKSAEKGVGGD